MFLILHSLSYCMVCCTFQCFTFLHFYETDCYCIHNRIYFPAAQSHLHNHWFIYLEHTWNNLINTQTHLYCVNMSCQFDQTNWVHKGRFALTKPVIAQKMFEGRPLFLPVLSVHCHQLSIIEQGTPVYIAVWWLCNNCVDKYVVTIL